MEAYVHITGYVGNDPEQSNGGSVPVTRFRLACTPRVRREGSWTDLTTTWVSVSCFRGLAEHVAVSVKKGDPVIVVGKLRTTTFERDGDTVTRLGIDAETVGHDLERGTTTFTRAERPVLAEEPDGEEATAQAA